MRIQTFFMPIPYFFEQSRRLKPKNLAIPKLKLDR